MAKRTIVRGGQVLLRRNDEWSLDHCDLWISEGIIERIAPHDPERPVKGNGLIEANGCLVLPGLINSHYHSHDNLVRGMGPEQPLELWSLAYTSLRNDYTPKEAYFSTLLGCAELMASGCTGVIDHIKFSPHLELSLLDAVCQAYLDAGLRVCVVPVVADRPVEETLPLTRSELEACATDIPSTSLTAPQQVSRVTELHARWHGRDGRIKIGIGPSGPQRCTDALLRLSANWAKENSVPIHMHVLETRLQRATAWRLYGVPMVEHLVKLKLLTPHTHLVHMVWPSSTELDQVADHGAIVVHNPISNVRLGSGTAPIPQMVERRIPVALGVDSACCNDGNDIFSTMKWAALIHNLSSPNPSKWLRSENALTFATLGGATALDGGSSQNGIATGKAADLTFIDLTAPGLVPLNAPIRQLVLAGDSRAVASTMVAGQIICEHGQPKLFNLASVHNEIQSLAERRLKKHETMLRDNTLENLVRQVYQRVAVDEASSNEGQVK